MDKDGAYQYIPDTETAYHAGDGSGKGNTQSIGIEICMNSDGDLSAATNNAAELADELCKKYSVPLGNVVQHNHWSGKNCPQMIRAGKPYSLEQFIEKVKEGLQPVKNKIESVEEALALLVEKGVINTADYCQNAVKTVKNLDALLIKFAEYINE